MAATDQNPLSNVGSDTSSNKAHFVLVPFMAQGHMIPMTDMALLLAAHGSLVTYVTTPRNAARISTTISHVDRSRLPINFVLLNFPAVEAGIPKGIENADMLPSISLLENFVDACCMLHDPLVLHLRNHHRPPPTCIISDNLHYWTRSVARELNIPRLIFHGYGCFPLLCIRNTAQPNNAPVDENEPFVIPGLPDKIEITRAQLPSSINAPRMPRHRDGVIEADIASSGVVVNSFDDLEPLYVEWCRRATGKKFWTIGPLSLCGEERVAARGDEASISEDLCLKWLNSMSPSSVVLVSFGSLARTTAAQVVEIGLGLEASSCPFIWVVKAWEKFSEVDGWLSEFERRNEGRGLVIRGWAPQAVILAHDAVGGFMTHCGWNSTLESIASGVPMITWPHFGDQFLNEKLVVEVLGVGVGIGVKDPTRLGVETSEVLVNKVDVERAVRWLMLDEGKVAGGVRDRAKELREKARKAVEEGGSSYNNLADLVQQMSAPTE